MNINEIMARGISTGYNLDDAAEYGINCAIVLNRLRFLHRHTQREDGFTWQTSEDWNNYTGLSKFQTKEAITKLANLGIIEVKNTYIIGTQVKCRHQRFIENGGGTEQSESKETEQSESKETALPVYNKEHNKEHKTFFKQPKIKIDKLTGKVKLSNLEQDNVRKVLNIFATQRGGVYDTPYNNTAIASLISQQGIDIVLAVAEFALALEPKPFQPTVSQPIDLAQKWDKFVTLMDEPSQESKYGIQY